MIGIPRRTIHMYPGEVSDLLSTALKEPSEHRALVSAFEDAFTRHAGDGLAVPVGAGRLGLRLIFESLNIGAGDSVVVPAFTDQSVPNAVRRVGAEPVFVDVERETYNIDPKALEAILDLDRDRPIRAVIATHIFGAPCDLNTISALCAARNITVLEDCAHAIDARSQGRRCGLVGEAAIFSFVVTKAVNTFGGGMVLTRKKHIADYVREATRQLPQPKKSALGRRIIVGWLLHQFTRPAVFGNVGLPIMNGLKSAGGDAISSYNKFVRPGTQNAHVDTAFSPIQAAAGLTQLRMLGSTQSRRTRAATQIIASLPPHVRAQGTLTGDQHAWYFLVATTENPDAVVSALSEQRVDVGRYPMRNVAALEDPTNGPLDFPNAQWVYEHSIQIPIHPTLSEDHIGRVCRAFSRI